MGFTEEQFAFMQREMPVVFHRTFRSSRTAYEAMRLDLQLGHRKNYDAGAARLGSSPSMGPTSGHELMTDARPAYYLNGMQLEPIVMWKRFEQKFELHAKPWEKWWSKLFADRVGAFVPILDANDTLVGALWKSSGC